MDDLPLLALFMLPIHFKIAIALHDFCSHPIQLLPSADTPINNCYYYTLELRCKRKRCTKARCSARRIQLPVKNEPLIINRIYWVSSAQQWLVMNARRKNLTTIEIRKLHTYKATVKFKVEFSPGRISFFVFHLRHSLKMSLLKLLGAKQAGGTGKRKTVKVC